MDRSAWENQENNSVFDVAAGLEAQGIMWAEQHAAPWQKKAILPSLLLTSQRKVGPERSWKG